MHQHEYPGDGEGRVQHTQVMSARSSGACAEPLLC